MLLQQIDLSPDIVRLRSERFEVQLIDNYLLVHNIPYINPNKELKKGTLVTDVSIANNQVTRPSSHVIFFIGDFPCNVDGSEIHQLKHNSSNQMLGGKIVINHSFSNKPTNGYSNYYDKITRYISIISAPALSLDNNLTVKTGGVWEDLQNRTSLRYFDTNSTKSGISDLNDKISNLKIGIVGLGGTGSYILDVIAKNNVKEIHLFDGDSFLQHNAFRTPGAPSIEDLGKEISKVDYLSEIYSKMHKNILTHNWFVSKSNVGKLREMDFVFICIDRGVIKEDIFKVLVDASIPFIDVGLGISKSDNSLLGMTRVTLADGNNYNHLWDGNKISFTDELDDDYKSNIQIAELNMLNAALAVIKWKKYYQFFSDLSKEYHSSYTINVNRMYNE